MSYADACQREAAWFLEDHTGQGMPNLLLNTTAGVGFFDTIQAYRRKLSTSGYSCWISREPRVHEERLAFGGGGGQGILHHQFAVRLEWTIRKTAGGVEADQVAFDLAIDAVLQRIRGFPGDKTHGGRFHEVGPDAGSGVQGQGAGTVVEYRAFEDCLADGTLVATVRYLANDWIIE